MCSLRSLLRKLAMDENSTSFLIRKCCNSSNYVFTGKLMLTSVVVLVLVCLVLVFFRVCARRVFRRHHRDRVFREASDAADFSTSQGLDPSMQESLPTFVHSSSKGRRSRPLECSVCLSELKDNETGRVLPECEHCFHADCIGTWFRSHTNCPLCRARILPVQNPVHLVNQTGLELKWEAFDVESRMESTSGYPPCRSGENDMACFSSKTKSIPSSDTDRRKALALMGVTVEPPVTSKQAAQPPKPIDRKMRVAY